MPFLRKRSRSSFIGPLLPSVDDYRRQQYRRYPLSIPYPRRTAGNYYKAMLRRHKRRYRREATIAGPPDEYF